MLERILVPLDGSLLAESVLVQVRRLLTYKDAEVLLLRAVTTPTEDETDGVTSLQARWSKAAEYLQDLGGRLAAEGVRVSTKVAEGPAADAILAAAAKERVGLIAMSTHGRGGLARWVFGSVTEKILRASPVPVLAVPSFSGTGGDAFPTGGRELPFRRILAPVAADDVSLEIVPALVEFAELFGSRVSLLNVCEGPACTVAVPQLREAHDRLRKGGVAVEPIMRQGDPAVEILAASREQGAELIAMTTHGQKGLPRWVLGSVAEKVLRAAGVPLLVVRTTREARPKPAKRSAPRTART